jgi:hypothetical protein
MLSKITQSLYKLSFLKQYKWQGAEDKIMWFLPILSLFTNSVLINVVSKIPGAVIFIT